MRRPLFATSAAFAAILCGCSAAPIADGRFNILPIERVQHAMSRAEAMYHTGRYFQGQIRYDQALRAYRAALEENPDHVAALNGMAVVEASLGQFADAETHFRQAIALAPDAAYLYNNLGYAYLREGRATEGQVAIARALELEPDNPHYAANFDTATEAIAHRRQQAATLAHFGERDAEDRAEAKSATTDRHSRIEIANGNGIRGMAARTAGLLRDFGLPAARLTNARPYRQWQTEIQYLAGHELEADRIEALLPVDARLVEISAMQRGIEVRLIVGHDLRDASGIRTADASFTLLAVAAAAGRQAP